MDDLFIEPGVEISLDHPLRRHFVSLTPEQVRDRWNQPRGHEILRRWEESGYDRAALSAVVGTMDHHLDIRGVSLRSRSLAGRDLSRLDLFRADLEGADLSRANLTETYLSEANVRGTRFDWARMDGVFLDNAVYDNRTSFLGVDLSRVNFTLAALLHDLAFTQQRITHLKQRSPWVAWFLEVTSDYGLSLSRYFAWVSGILLGFALLYWLIPGAISRSGVLNALYFSVVTFTTLGYGDVVPASSIGQILAITEVCIGYVMGGLLVTILARRLILG